MSASPPLLRRPGYLPQKDLNYLLLGASSLEDLPTPTVGSGGGEAHNHLMRVLRIKCINVCKVLEQLCIFICDLDFCIQCYVFLCHV